MADLAGKNTDSITKAFTAGIISQRTALKELRQQAESTGIWSNITDEDIERVDDTAMQPDEGLGGLEGLTMDAWEESKHPRSPDGKFGSGGGSKGKRNIKRKRTGIRLKKEEYARVMSAFNTDLTDEERESKIITRAVGNYVYTAENHGFNSYIFLRRRKLK